MSRFTFEAASETQTERFGSALAETLPPGTTVALVGTLGAGKTRLVQAIAAAWGIERAEITSPTFVLLQEYHGRKTICHLDAYRVADDDEFLALGVDELFASDALVLIEWADRVRRCLPEDRIEIHIEVTGRQSRRFEIVAIGHACEPILDALQAEIGRRE